MKGKTKKKALQRKIRDRLKELTIMISTKIKELVQGIRYRLNSPRKKLYAF